MNKLAKKSLYDLVVELIRKKEPDFKGGSNLKKICTEIESKTGRRLECYKYLSKYLSSKTSPNIKSDKVNVKLSGGVAMPNETKWLTADGAAQYLGLPSRDAVFQAVRRGEIRAHRFGARRLRFLKEDLDAVMHPMENWDLDRMLKEAKGEE